MSGKWAVAALAIAAAAGTLDSRRPTTNPARALAPRGDAVRVADHQPAPVLAGGTMDPDGQEV
jgi:hypothetical protein